ncbi:MAG: hypothetical protein GX422_12015 [Deltaproteobacteria bacterium]|nr:hypothetical protein [Deltaproteobacteria bacterium]
MTVSAATQSHILQIGVEPPWPFTHLEASIDCEVDFSMKEQCHDIVERDIDMGGTPRGCDVALE